MLNTPGSLGMSWNVLERLGMSWNVLGSCISVSFSFVLMATPGPVQKEARWDSHFSFDPASKYHVLRPAPGQKPCKKTCGMGPHS